jgi:hypothetical protein
MFGVGGTTNFEKKVSHFLLAIVYRIIIPLVSFLIFCVFQQNSRFGHKVHFAWFLQKFAFILMTNLGEKVKTNNF